MSAAATHYGLTCLSPVLPGRATDVRRFLAELAAQPGSPLERLAMLHIARWYVIDRLPDARERVSDVLTCPWLVFVAHIDGHRDDFLDELFSLCPDVVRPLYGCCAGFEGVRHPYQFRRYMRRCEVRPTLFYAGAPGAGVSDIKRALELRSGLIRFIQDEQDRPARDRRKRLLDYARRQRTPQERPTG